MQMVEMPMVMSAVTRVVLRPTRSPKCPKIAAPIGPRDKGQRKRRQRLQGGDCRIAFGKEQARKHQYRGGGIDIEIIELDGGSDHAGQKNAARLPRIGRKVRVEQWQSPAFRYEFCRYYTSARDKISAFCDRPGMDGAARPAGAGR